MTRQFPCGFIVAAMAMLIVCSTSFGDEPPFEVVLERPGDSAIVREVNDQTWIFVTSTSGIGRMTLSSRDRAWPRQVTLRLSHQGGQAFKVLEGFEMTSSRWQVRSSSNSAGKVPFFLADDEGHFSRDDLNPSGWFKVGFQQNDGGLDISFPAHLLHGEKKVKIQWIDYYRT